MRATRPNYTAERIMLIIVALALFAAAVILATAATANRSDVYAQLTAQAQETQVLP